MTLDKTMIQWLTTPVKDHANFQSFCHRDFMQIRKESDYCFTVYFDKNFQKETHNVLDLALDKFQLEKA